MGGTFWVRKMIEPGSDKGKRRIKPSTDYAESNLCNLWMLITPLFQHGGERNGARESLLDLRGCFVAFRG